MINAANSNWRVLRISLPLVCGAVVSIAAAYEDPAVSNPITQLARAINPKLVKVDDKINWLDHQAATLSKYCQFPLKYGIGYRGCRTHPNAPDPTIVMDLGKVLPIDSIYLVPTQSEYLNDSGIFPTRFTIEVSSDGYFHESTIIYRTGKKEFNPTCGAPVKFSSKREGRYIRISVQSGHNKDAIDMFGFSEIFVISNRQPVSFDSQITTTGDLNIEGMWYPDALVDGRTPLGIWHHGESNQANLGDVVITEPNHTTSWNATLPASAAIDRIILFPYQMNRSYEVSIFPEAFRIEISETGDPPFEVAYEWKNPIHNINHMTPIVIPMGKRTAKYVNVVATQPWKMSNRQIHALSEIEIWSEDKNIINGIPITRIHDAESTTITSLTDGDSSEKQISPIAIWLEQLTKRGQIDEELVTLKKAYQNLSSQSELNVSWGASIILGLTFLIPVFIVERKRMRNREHLDLIRKRIASDLHDDIGSNLGSISLIARTARKDLARLKGPAQIDDDLGEVETIARESSLAMRDIVWLLERKQDSIGDLVHRMRETAGRLMREINFTVECTSTKTAAKLSLDAKRHLFLFYKEAIHNIVKHSRASEVSIRLWDEGEQLALEIQDDGMGLPMTKDRVTISIKKLEERAEVLNGILQITSSQDTGTCIRLLIKRSQLIYQPVSQ